MLARVDLAKALMILLLILDIEKKISNGLFKFAGI